MLGRIFQPFAKNGGIKSGMGKKLTRGLTSHPLQPETTPTANGAQDSNGETYTNLIQQLEKLDLERDNLKRRIQEARPKSKRTILFLGAGLSSSSAINYLLSHAKEGQWTLRVGDSSLETARSKVEHSDRGEAFQFDAENASQITDEVRKADIVVSLLPMKLHPKIARECVAQKKHMVTASYVSDEMKAIHSEAVSKGYNDTTI